MSKYYIDLTNFSTGYGKLARRAAKALNNDDIPGAALGMAKLSHKILRRNSRDPQYNKMTKLHEEKLERKISRPLDKAGKDPYKKGAVAGYLAGRYPKLTEEVNLNV